jgi:hypothetical protein
MITFSRPSTERRSIQRLDIGPLAAHLPPERLASRRPSRRADHVNRLAARQAPDDRGDDG